MGSFCIVDVLIDAGVPRSNFLGDEVRALAALCERWRHSMAESGEQPWRTLGVGCERESGYFDAFFDYGSPTIDLSQPTVSQPAKRVVAEAWARLDIVPRFEFTPNE